MHGNRAGSVYRDGTYFLVYSKDLSLSAKPPELSLKLQVWRLRLRIEDLRLGLGTNHGLGFGLGFGHRSPVPYD